MELRALSWLLKGRGRKWRRRERELMICKAAKGH